MNVYVIVGETGEYSDRSVWIVKAFANEENAKEFVIKATEKAKEIYLLDRDLSWEESEKLIKSNEYDPFFKMNYTGTSYYYEEVLLEGAKNV